jgi:NAD(P)-dependent dehydrogenase (short-subunit alcohol dehydrogenase family)
MRDFKGKVMAITGAGNGIGRALACAFAEQGARLALSDIDEPALQETADLVVNLIANNAGVSLAAAVSAMKLEDFEWLMNINFWGVVHGTQAFLPHLIRSGEGHIVNLSSVFGLMAAPTQSAYNAAKFAVKGFTESLRMEMLLEQRPVGVTCVHPGGISTSIVRTSRHTERPSPPYREREETVREFETELARNTPEYCARVILRGVRRNAPQLLVGADAKLIDLFVRCLPRRYPSLVVSQLRRRWAQQRGGRG